MAESIQYRQGTPPYPRLWRRSHTSRDEVGASIDRPWAKSQSPAEPIKLTFHDIQPLEPLPIDAVNFQRLVSAWRKDTAANSSLAKKVMHPAYQRIIGMGPPVVPLILKEMKRRSGHWFWALDAITQGADPAIGCNNLDEATEAWIRWGEEKGLL